MPGGHNALAQAHRDFADPLYEALTNNNQGGQQTGGPINAEALPNPWGAPSGGAAAGAGRGGTSAPATTTPAPASQAPTAAGANPMAAMMQQMMGGGAPLGGGATNPTAATPNPM